MATNNIAILKSHEVVSLLEGKEKEIVETVSKAYLTHARAESSLPHSTFLRFPHNPRNRVISLPAYLGGEFEVVGLKWIGSFPGNIENGLDRASAVIILNSPLTGKPEVILEGSVISAKRTAASAALAAVYLHRRQEEQRVAFVGCGLINFETARFLLATIPEISQFAVFDIDKERATRFKEKCKATFGGVDVEIMTDVATALGSASLISIATTAQKPHISDLSGIPPSATILHISLRDLTPELILSCDNIVDDADHVCRAETSLHLAEQIAGNRNFIRSTLADVVQGLTVARRADDSTVVFSPFGLGILDLVVAQLVSRFAVEEAMGTTVANFLPDSWADPER